jgi:DNA-binding NarL/FixJ family response regulator
MRIVMVDDHLVVRDGLKTLLEISGIAQVVGAATCAEEAIGLVGQTPCDLILLDIELPSNDGIWCTRELKSRHPHLPILILTMHSDDRLVVEALQAGADGYLIKSASFEEVVRALRDLHAGKTYVDPRVARSLLTELRRERPKEGDAVPGKLSPREHEILVLAATGLNNKDIAERLTLTQNTVKTHLRSIYRKCGVPDRVQAVLYALRNGMVPGDTAEPAGRARSFR